MKKVLVLFFLSILLILGTSFSVNAGLIGTYYNLSSAHPDMQVYTGGAGMVEIALTGSAPTETAATPNYSQFDWWDSQYFAFQREDSDADLQSNFSSSFFPISSSLPGDPYHFAVHWEGQFYVDTAMNYNYSMGSDDDSWLFIDNQLVLDLGGVHGMSYTDYTLSLEQGYHDIDIFFAERHTTGSGFQLNFFSDLEPPINGVPEPATMLLLGSGLIGLVGFRRKKLFKE